MPNYNFYDPKTRKTVTLEMKISELDTFLKDNPHLQQTLQPIPSVDPHAVGRTRTDSRFRDVLKKIKRDQPGSTIRTDNITEI
jgi:hypothetical protein